MKKVLSLVLAVAVLATLCLALASCGKKLSGTYELDVIVGGKTYEFKGNKVTISYELFGAKKSSEGTYKIAKNDDGDLEITFTFENKEAEEYSGTFSFEEVDKDTIKIAGVKYEKKD